MLCCFRAPQTAESPQEASRPPPPKVVDPVKASSLNDANTEAPAGQHVPAPAETAISEHKALVLDGATASIPESWRFRLQQHITELIALRGFSAARWGDCLGVGGTGSRLTRSRRFRAAASLSLKHAFLQLLGP